MHTIPYRKTYLSLSLSRAIAAEYPIGDPYGGPAYGERNAPAVVAVVTFIAANAGTIALVGTALSVVGSVTGNKTLSRVGMVMGVVGGGFSLAQQGAFNFIDEGIQQWAVNAANGFQTTAQAIAESATIGADTIGTTAGAETGIEAGVGTTVDTQLNLAAAPSAAESGGLVSAPSVEAAVGTGEAQMNANLADISAKIAKDNAAADLAAGTASGTGTTEAATGIADAATAAPSAEAAAPSGASSISSNAADAALNGPVVASGESANVLSGIGQWIEKNKGLTEIGLKFGQGLLTEEPEANPLHGAQAQALQQQMANARAVPDITKMFRANPQAKIARPGPVFAPGFRPGGLIQAR